MSCAFSTNYPLFFGRAVVGFVRIGTSFHFFATMKNAHHLLLLAFACFSLVASTARSDSSAARPLPDWAENVRTNASAASEADFRDRSLLPLLRAETLDRFDPPASWSAELADEARAYVEDELRLAWEGPARMTDRPGPEWGHAYDFTVKEGSRDPFLAWMSVVGQHKWHWDDKARAQLSELEAGLAALPPESEPFRRLLAAHARQLLDPSEDHARALCAAAVRWAESHAAHPDRSEAVLRILAQFVDTANPALVPALLRSSADPWIAFALGGDAAFARARTSVSPEGRAASLALAASSYRRAWELHPDFPQGAAGMALVCGIRRDREGLRLWFGRGAEARFDFIPLHDRYIVFLRPSWGGSPGELRAHADACLDLGRPESMLPWCAAMARIVELETSGTEPAAFFMEDGPDSRLERALAAFLDRGTGTDDSVSESAEFLACLRWTRGDLPGAEDAFSRSRNNRYRRMLNEGFSGAFGILEALSGLTGPNATLVRSRWRQFKDGGANATISGAPDGALGLPDLSEAEAALLFRISLQSFLRDGFRSGESRRVTIFDRGFFLGWFDYGAGWQPSDDGRGGSVFPTGSCEPGCLEFAQALPLPIELEIFAERDPSADDKPFFAIRVLPADGLVHSLRGISPPVSVRWKDNGKSEVRLGSSDEPFADAGWTGGVVASSQVSVPLGAGDSSSSNGTLNHLPVRIVFAADRVSVFLDGSAAPVLSAPCGSFTPDAFPDGAKLVFFGRGVRFRGFSFRKPSTDSQLSQEGGSAP